MTKGTVTIGKPYVTLDSNSSEAIVTIHIPMDYEIIDIFLERFPAN